MEITDIHDRVHFHCATAHAIALVEHLPPGYTKEQWVIHLMDSHLAELLDRWGRRKKQYGIDEQVMVASQDQTKPLSEKLTPKLNKLKDAWAREAFEWEGQRLLDAMGTKGKGRDAKAESLAGTIVWELWRKIQVGVGWSPRFRGRVHQFDDGSFRLHLWDV